MERICKVCNLNKLEFHKKYCFNCKKKIMYAARKNFKLNNPEKVKLYAKKSSKKQDKIKKKIRYLKWFKKAYKTNPEFRLKHLNRSRIRNILKGKCIKNDIRTIELIGCSPSELRKYIENKFKKGMTWDNWGIHTWHVDHVIPISKFDLSNQVQLKQAFHYTNLQPLWAKDNLKKSNK